MSAPWRVAHAQAVYVSNAGQRTLSPGVELISAGMTSHAQQFTTGYRAGGHTRSVRFRSA